MSNMCTCHIDQTDCLYCLYFIPLERECEQWKQRALEAEAKLEWKQPTPSEPLTAKQQELYDYLVQHVQQHYYFPSVREMSVATDCVVSVAHNKLAALVEKGMVEKVGQRTFRLVRG